MTEARCDLCGALLKLRRSGQPKPCVRCHKGGRGETPQPGGPAWRQWISGCIGVASRRLVEAGVGDVSGQILACFADVGDVSPQAAAVLRPWLERPCSPRRYYAAVDRAIERRRNRAVATVKEEK